MAGYNVACPAASLTAIRSAQYTSIPSIGCRQLQALAREASFYQLPVLLDHISSACIMPQPGTSVQFDTLYLETGYKALEGPELIDMEK